jgi:hypothetical protein
MEYGRGPDLAGGPETLSGSAYCTNRGRDPFMQITKEPDNGKCNA